MSRASNELREEILYWCRESVRTGLNFPTQGNLSIRLPEHEAIVITPSGIRYDVLTIDQMVVVGYDGVVIARPSFLLGDRTALGQPERTGEKIAARVGRWVGPVLPANLRPIRAVDVARALLRTVPQAKAAQVLLSGDMQPA